MAVDQMPGKRCYTGHDQQGCRSYAPEIRVLSNAQWSNEACLRQNLEVCRCRGGRDPELFRDVEAAHAFSLVDRLIRPGKRKTGNTHDCAEQVDRQVPDRTSLALDAR